MVNGKAYKELCRFQFTAATDRSLRLLYRKMVKNMKNRVLYVLTIGAVIISIVAIVVAVCRIEPVTAEWMGILIGILGLLTSVLLGWQVFSIINLRGMEGKLKSLEEISRKGDSEAIGKAYDGIATLYITSVPDGNKTQDEIISDHIYGYLLFTALAMVMQSEAGNYGYCESTIGHLLKINRDRFIINERQRDNIFDIAVKVTSNGNIKNYPDYLRWIATLV